MLLGHSSVRREPSRGPRTAVLPTTDRRRGSKRRLDARGALRGGGPVESVAELIEHQGLLASRNRLEDRSVAIGGSRPADDPRYALWLELRRQQVDDRVERRQLLLALAGHAPCLPLFDRLSSHAEQLGELYAAEREHGRDSLERPLRVGQ